MKFKKARTLIILGIILILLILTTVYIVLNNKNKKEEINEYIPQEEISESQIRKTIISLYFKNNETNSVIPESRCIDVKELYNEPYKYLIEQLIKGPESEKLSCVIPEGTKVNSCTIKENTVYVDLSKEFIENAKEGIDEESMIVYSIVNTLTELNEVSEVKILIEGEENKSFKDNKISFKENFKRND